MRDGTDCCVHRGFLKWGYPQRMVCFMENPIKIDDLGVPPFQETSIYRQIFAQHHITLQRSQRIDTLQYYPVTSSMTGQLTRTHQFLCVIIIDIMFVQIFIRLMIIHPFQEYLTIIREYSYRYSQKTPPENFPPGGAAADYISTWDSMGSAISHSNFPSGTSTFRSVHRKNFPGDPFFLMYRRDAFQSFSPWKTLINYHGACHGFPQGCYYKGLLRQFRLIFDHIFSFFC